MAGIDPEINQGGGFKVDLSYIMSIIIYVAIAAGFKVGFDIVLANLA